MLLKESVGDKFHEKMKSELLDSTSLYPKDNDFFKQVPEYSIPSHEHYEKYKNKISPQAEKLISDILDIYKKCPLSGLKTLGVACVHYNPQFVARQKLAELFFKLLKDENQSLGLPLIELAQSFIEHSSVQTDQYLSRALLQFSVVELYKTNADRLLPEIISIIRSQYKSTKNSVTFMGIYAGANPLAWHSFWKDVFELDPVIGKSILIGILKSYRLPKSEKISGINFQEVAQKLYECECSHPEETDEGAFNVLVNLLWYGYPDSDYWNEALNRGLELALKLDKEKDGQAYRLVGFIAFYASEDSGAQKKAMERLEKNFVDRERFADTLDPFLIQARCILEFCSFCGDKKNHFRNANFSPNRESKLYNLASDAYWKLCAELIEKKNVNALKCLFVGMRCHDKLTTKRACKKYKEVFRSIALRNPKDASTNLKHVASSSLINYSGVHEPLAIRTKHQNKMLFSAFDSAIKDLKEIDLDLAYTSIKGFMRSHISVTIPPEIQEHINEANEYGRQKT